MLESLREDVKNGYRSRGCAIGRFMRNLSASDREILSGLLDDPHVTSGAIARALAQYAEELGVKLSDQMVSRHRRRGLGTGCSCA